jgi:hypothetical protein
LCVRHQVRITPEDEATMHNVHEAAARRRL